MEEKVEVRKLELQELVMMFQQEAESHAQLKKTDSRTRTSSAQESNMLHGGSDSYLLMPRIVIDGNSLGLNYVLRIVHCVRKYCVGDLSSCAGSELGNELTSLAGSELGSELTSFAGSDLSLASYSKENWVNILKLIDEGPFQMGTLRETLTEGALHLGLERPRVYSDLTSKKKDRMQLNSKFVNNMLPEWGRFVTAVKLNRGLRDSNYDQLYTFLKQYEAHANENKMMLDRFTSDPRHKMRPNMLIDITIRVSNASSLINLRVAFDAINDCRLSLAPLVYMLVRPSPIPPVPVAPAGQQVTHEILAAHATWINGSKEIAGLMLMTMEPEIQRNLEPLHAHEMLKELKTLFAQQAEQELFQTTRDFHSCKQEEGYMGKTVNELHAMLKLHEQTLPKSNAPALNAIRAGKVQKAVEATGSFYLCLPSGLEIVLNNCHYAPSITRGFISVSRLYEDGFVNRFIDNTIQVSRNNVVYFCAIPRDGIFKIDLSNFLTNESYVYAVSNKRAKLDLDSALLWHCRLGDISKKHIEKLQHEGLLNSSDLTTFEKCV
nr:hypothetical protein [Tanacetum cinerariifolium]